MKLKKYMPGIIWAFFVFVVCVIRITEIARDKTLDLPLDKIVHAVLYFVLCFLLISAFKKTKNNYRIFKYTFLLAAFISFSYGVFIELIQDMYVPYRSAEINDVLANTIGIAMSLIGYASIRKRLIRIKLFERFL